MDTHKTAQEWFATLEEGYRERALANSDERGTLHPSFEEALLSNFVWDDTPEGFCFWDKMHEFYCGNPDFPTLPTISN